MDPHDDGRQQDPPAIPPDSAKPDAAAQPFGTAAQSADSAAFLAGEGHPYTQNRELSWLDFNKRVLDLGADENIAPLERFNFISIFWSNLQEFFMIRVGSLSDLLLLKNPVVDQKTGMTVSEQLRAIYARCHELYPYYEQTYATLCRRLDDEGVEHMHPSEIDDKARSYLDKYMRDNVMPLLAPQIVNARHPFPHLENGRLYVVVRLDDRKTKEQKAADRAQKEAERAAAAALAADIASAALEADGQAAQNGDAAAEGGRPAMASPGKPEGAGTSASASGAATPHAASAPSAKKTKNLGAEGVTLGIIPLPNQCERLVRLPGKKLKFVLLEDLIEMHAAEIFSMYKVRHTNVICVTRNADLDATEGSDEQGEDYREHMKRILRKRARLAPVRLECRHPLSNTVKTTLLDRLKLKNYQVFISSVPLDLSYTYKIAELLAPERRAELSQPPFSPAWPASLRRGHSILKQVVKHEVLLSYPYESIEPFVQLLNEAAIDKNVISIKITLYRLASQSRLAEALIEAAEEGKEVTILLELRARFDESNNIEWSQRFEQSGCHVIYGFHDMKVHSKICVITRQTDDGITHITQLGTGNYNEKTARLYTDFSFITSDEAIGLDADRFFRNMSLENTSDNYDLFWVAPLQIKQNIMGKIDEQIELANAGEPCGLFFKTNAITDMDVINKIVQASQAGVPVTLFVRGISCIVPGVAGYTENVRVVSIIGRFLEHSRVYCFGPLETSEIYLSSADLMSRNLDKRIEVAWPVLNERLHDEVIRYLNVSMADTAKLRELRSDGSYTPLGYFATVCDAEGNAEPLGAEGMPELFDSQTALIAMARQIDSAPAEASRKDGGDAAGTANEGDDVREASETREENDAAVDNVAPVPPADVRDTAQAGAADVRDTAQAVTADNLSTTQAGAAAGKTDEGAGAQPQKPDAPKPRRFGFFRRQ